MSKTQIGVLAALCALALGCGETDALEANVSPVVVPKGDAGSMNIPKGDAGSMVVPEDDAGPIVVPPSDCKDDPATLGNDCPGVVTCTDAVDACSLATQNCCVKAYDAKKVSCNEGTACDGLASAACDGPEDCGGGQVCCISVTLKGAGADIDHRCVSDATQCSGGLITNSVMCHTDDDCESPKACQKIGNLPFWGSCK